MPEQADPPPANLCDACNGACCREMNKPPFTLTEIKGLPEAIWADHVASMNMWPRLTSDSCPVGVPCFWLAPDNRCKHYEHRPGVCRDMPMGGESCVSWRARRDKKACPRCRREHDIIHILKLDEDPFRVEIHVGHWMLTASTPQALAIQVGALLNEIQCCRRQLAAKTEEPDVRT